MTKRAWVTFFCVLVALTLFATVALAKKAERKYAGYQMMQIPEQVVLPLDLAPLGGPTMFQAAAANTVVLGWWQFDNANGTPNKQGWTEYDLTAQLKRYFHVAGSAVGCDAITPIAGTKSMWCGQNTTTADPWSDWCSLPGYGNNWDQYLSTNVGNTVANVTYTIKWDSEPGYDFTYIQWWDPVNSVWVTDPLVNGGLGSYDANGGPQTEVSTSTFGPTMMRFYFTSDGAWSGEDGLWPTTGTPGAVVLDDLAINGGPVESWEGETCGATQSSDSNWVASVPPGFGLYSGLVSAATVVQEDPCLRPLSNLWEFYDDPAVTNYGCGGWPSQGAMPYGRANGLYMNNEVWSPWIPVSGSGTSFLLQFLTYRDLPLDNLQFYVWHVRTRNMSTGGCPTTWRDNKFVYYGGQKDWIRQSIEVGPFMNVSDTHMQVALGAVDMCGVWCGINGTGACHSHAPLFDQVRVVRVGVVGPQWTVRGVDLWQDNFPEEGLVEDPDGAGPLNAYARCDMAQDIIPSNKPGILPGDSLKVVVTDPVGLADDATGGRARKAVYVFVKVTDRFGTPVAFKNGLAIQSPDNQAWSTDPSAGMLRFPLAAGIAPLGWDAYRMDYAYTEGGRVKDGFCADLMDLGAGPLGPHYKHANENVAANVGIFEPGDVINYILAAKNLANEWSYIYRTYNGQGTVTRTNNVTEATSSPMEWSVLPDAGRLPADQGDILFVDDADDRGGPAELFFDTAFKQVGLDSLVDRYDVLGASSAVGNSLASRVKNIANQMIGDPVEVYQIVLWNSSNLSKGLMGDGGTPNGGSSAEKSNDFGLAYTFLNQHPNDPSWAYWGDNVVQDWNTLTGLGAVITKATFMNHWLMTGDQRDLTGVMSPQVFAVNPLPPAPWLRPIESFVAYGGCAAINDFDVLVESGNSRVAHRYANASPGFGGASLSQWTINFPEVADTARFFLAGFGYDFIRDDTPSFSFDRVEHLREILEWFQNTVGPPEWWLPWGLVLYVDQSAEGLEDGSSWTNAFRELRDALGWACLDPGPYPWHEIWVAAGTYKPTSISDPTNRTATFQLVDDVAVYGGFAGTETNASERDWAANPTILSGEIGSSSPIDNSYHVVTGSGTDSTAVLDGFTVTGGFTMSGDGGGMVNVNGSPTVRNVTFSSNLANSGGGMCNVTSSSPTLANVVFSGNSAFLNGGGLYDANSSPTLVSVTFSGNSAGNYGGGMFNRLLSNPTLTNTILWGNSASSGGDEIWNESPATPVISFSIIEGCGSNGAGWNDSLGTDGGHNKDADPLFVDESYGNLRLAFVSPATDAGDNGAPHLPATDLDGNPRIFEGVVDMGAYEFQGCPSRTILYVDQSAWGSGDGSSWENAYTELRDAAALSGCPTVTEIWVAAGTHRPTAGSGRTATFRLNNGVALYGGFVGTETTLDERDWVANVTILSGDIGVEADSTDNSYHVVTGSRTDSTAVLDGFTVTGGMANGDSLHDGGGGMVNASGSPTIRDVTFLANQTSSEGGGGGMWNTASSSPTLINVTFSGNSSKSGGGMYNLFSSPKLVNVTFSGNSASIQGGGLANDTSSPTLVNVVFSGNSAAEGGGVYSVDSSNATFVNVAFSGNSAGICGGGMSNCAGSNPTLANTILWGDSATSGGDEIWNNSATPVISFSLIEGCLRSGAGWNDSLGTNGGHNKDADPLFVDAANGNLRLNGHSPAVNAGNTVALPPGVTTDLDGHDRVVAGIVDMGAYEVQAEDLVGIKTDQVPQPFRIVSVAPNPFNPSTTVHFTLPAAMPVTARIWSVTGARVRVLANGRRFEPGDNRLVWDGRNDQGSPVSSGVYFVRIETELGAKVARAVLLK